LQQPAIGVSVAVAVAVSVGVWVGVAVGVSVGVPLGVAVGVSVGVLLAVAVGRTPALPQPSGEQESPPLKAISVQPRHRSAHVPASVESTQKPAAHGPPEQAQH